MSLLFYPVATTTFDDYQINELKINKFSTTAIYRIHHKKPSLFFKTKFSRRYCQRIQRKYFAFIQKTLLEIPVDFCCNTLNYMLF
uniref:Uncharacterized protein n=1 Tax=Candidatus Kentrum sp. LPFa TaxID=2126335 RepID=A0A450XT15_9GAMM|nr:MAG: hypothetical protein BECKLPF1236A_GA0070988_101729 [Candidatus Kentron sp. LPFa]VFK32415.1 MAG: hypothetical protein BECKLPF1236C_GA0070990_101662 [Candidatus Kentron sp. LPFa]